MDIILSEESTIFALKISLITFFKFSSSHCETVVNAEKSSLVKEINQKVKYLKEDKSIEVEYMTLLERDREKFQEGREEGREE